VSCLLLIIKKPRMENLQRGFCIMGCVLHRKLSRITHFMRPQAKHRNGCPVNHLLRKFAHDKTSKRRLLFRHDDNQIGMHGFSIHNGGIGNVVAKRFIDGMVNASALGYSATCLLMMCTWCMLSASSSTETPKT
jgi:hypothetical protein